MSDLSVAFRSRNTQSVVVAAIEQAELNTSGEIRVHLESKCKGDPLQRACFIFNHLKMYRTAQRNAVLIYVAYDSRKMAIVGDEGVNAVVNAGYWDHIIAGLASGFSEGRYAEALVGAVTDVGNVLKQFFPYQAGDINEQSNEISYGD